MGIQDRDCYREHHRNVTALRRKAAPSSTGKIAVFWIVLVAVLFAGIRFASRKESVVQRAAPQAQAESMSRASSSAPPAPVLPAPQASIQRDDRPAVGSTAIYRCGNSYSAAPCASGRRIEGPAASGFDSRPSESLANLVAQGRSMDTGGVTTVTNTVTTVENGVVTSVVSGGDGRAASCRQFAADIEGIDRAARQLQTMPQQDVLRNRRRVVRDQQAALRC